MKQLGFLALAVMLSGSVVAQDLDAVAITDQFDMGSRGNINGGSTGWGGNWGASHPGGFEYEDYSGSDMSTDPVTTSIRYINTWASAHYLGNSEVESPVSDITVGAVIPDLVVQSLPPIPANNRPGATNGAMAVIVGDDSGYNVLTFGDNDDRNYEITVDVYCMDRSSVSGYEVVGVAARAGRNQVTDDPSTLTKTIDYSFNPDRAGSYSIHYDSITREVKAVKWRHGNTSGEIASKDPEAFTQFGDTISNVAEGWHTMRIHCFAEEITFYFDDVEIASVTDPDYPSGRPLLYYRENNTSPPSNGVFDNLRTQPTSPAYVSAWSLY